MKTVFTAGDLCDILEGLSLTRRKAVLYCLETESAPKLLLTLRWQSVFKAPLTDLARQIVRSMPRHLNLDYVFWEYVGKDNIVAAPLFGMEESIQLVSGYSYQDLQSRYNDIVWVDDRAELSDFTEHMALQLVS